MTQPRACLTSGTIHIWMQTAVRAQPKKLVLLGAKAEQAITTMKNVGAEHVGRQNGSL